MSYAHAASEDHDRTVGVEDCVSAVRSFNVRGNGGNTGRGALSLFEQLIGKAGAATDDE